MSDQPRYTVVPVEWNAARERLRAVRYRVFVVEQNVPEELEWDAEDETSRHVLARSAEGEAIGTGRLLSDGHIGRMAVLAEWRGQGVGSALLRCLLRLAEEAGHAEVRLHAQTHSVGFYEKHGFAVEGAEFMEAGIPHFVMRKKLAADQPR